MTEIEWGADYVKEGTEKHPPHCVDHETAMSLVDNAHFDDALMLMFYCDEEGCKFQCELRFALTARPNSETARATARNEAVARSSASRFDLM